MTQLTRGKQQVVDMGRDDLKVFLGRDPRQVVDMLKNYFEDSEHNGWDGWTTTEMVTIYRLISDIEINRRHGNI